MPVQNRALKPDKTTSQNLANAALSYTTDYGRRFKLESVSLHASVAITETVTVTLDSAHGANYDVVLAKIDLDAEQDWVFRPQGELNLQVGDEIKIQCTAANVTGTVYATIKSSEITQ
jgi:hypothetical protein